MEFNGDHLVLLHSKSQNAFITDRLSEVIKRNMDLFVSGVSVDYVVIGIAETKEDLQRFKERLIELREIYLEKNPDSDLPEPQRIK